MRKIASPQDLQAELHRLLASCQEQHPSREKLALELRELADQVATTKTAALPVIIERGLQGPYLRHLRRAWEQVEDGLHEAQRQYNAAGGALPTADLNKIAQNFIVKPLQNLSEQAKMKADALDRSTR